VHVSAKDLGTGLEQTVRVTASSGLTEADIERIVQEADEQKQSDEERKERAQLKVTVDSLVYTTEQALNEYGKVLDKSEIDAIRSDIEVVRSLVEAAPLDDVREALSRLETSAHLIASRIYEQAGFEEEQ
jgi:molecular chaperone DnaK